MFLVNAAKYISNPDLQRELLDTGDQEIIGGASTWQWSKWNGLIQMKIRDLLKQEINLADVKTMPRDGLERDGWVRFIEDDICTYSFFYIPIDF